MLPFLALLLGPAHAQDAILPAGQEVRQAIHVDMTRYATEQTDDILRTFIPPSVDIDTLAGDQLQDSGQFGSSFAGLEYRFGVQGLVLVPELVSAALIPHDPEVCRENPGAAADFMHSGFLRAEFEVDLSLNPPPFAPAEVYAEAEASLLGFLSLDVLDEECDLRMPRTGFPAPRVKASIDVYLGFPVDDDDTTGQDDGLVDPIKGIGTPLYCPYTPHDVRGNWDWPDAAAAAGLGDACVPITVHVRDFTWAFTGIDDIDDLHLDCSGLANFFLTVADAFGIDPVEMLMETLRPTVDAQVAEALADVELQLAEQLAELLPRETGFGFVMDDVDLAGAALGVEVCPRDVFVDQRGLRVALSAVVDSGPLPHPCIAPHDPGGSRVTVANQGIGPLMAPLGDYNVPGYGTILPGAPRPTHPPEFVLGINDDLLNQALYATWRGGLLCQTISGETADFELPAGMKFDSSLLNMLTRDAYEDLFPEAKPLVIATDPRKPPVVGLAPDDPVNVAYVQLADMGVDLYSELDHRMTRVVGLQLEVNAGVDVAFDELEGLLGAAVDLDPSTIRPVVVYSELAPEGDEQLEKGLASLVGTLVGPLLDDALGSLTFASPSFAGLGLAGASLEAAGPGRDFLTVFGEVGVVAYGDGELQGCDLFGDGGGGCDAGGSCDGGGCASAPVGSRVVLLTLPFLVALLRRRGP